MIKFAGGGVWGGGSVSPSPENFWKIKLETIHFDAYLKQLFEMTNSLVNLWFQLEVIAKEFIFSFLRA